MPYDFGVLQVYLGAVAAVAGVGSLVTAFTILLRDPDGVSMFYAFGLLVFGAVLVTLGAALWRTTEGPLGHVLAASGS